VRDHLVLDCGIDEDRIVFHHGVPAGSLMDRFSDKAMSILDIVTLHRSILNDDIAKNIAMNHTNMIRSVYETLPSHIQWALFLEDDAKIDTDIFSMEQSQWTHQFLTTHPTIDVLMLGCLPYWGNPPFPASVYVGPYMVKNISRTLTAHAYILTRKGMEKLLYYADTTDPLKTVPFDQRFHECQMHVYTMFPMVCHPCRDPSIYRKFQLMVTPFQMVSFPRVMDVMMIVSLLTPVLLMTMFLWMTILLMFRFKKRSVR